MKSIMIIGLMAATIGMTSCASRTKDVQKSKSSFSLDAAIDTTASFTEMLKANATVETIESSEISSTSIEYDGEAGDSLSVAEYGADGKLKNRTVVHGKGKAKVQKGTSATTAKQTTNADSSTESNLQASGSKKIKSRGDEVGKTKHVESYGLPWWSWLILIVILILLALRWYLNPRSGGLI